MNIRRRHELNHAPDAAFPCPRPNCRKAFHRPDLLQRHMERQSVLQSPSQTSSLCINSDIGPSPESATFAPPGQHSQSLASEVSSITINPMASPPVAVQSTSHQPTGVPIDSLIHPSTSGERHASYKVSQLALNPYTRWAAGSIFPGITGPGEETVDYSDSSSSVSDYHNAYPHRSSIASSTGMDFYSTVSSPVWNSLPPNVFPSSIIEQPGHGFVPVRTPGLLSSTFTEADQSYADAPISLPLSHLDGDEWLAIKRALSTTQDGRLTNDTDGIFDTVSWHSYLVCYWRYFAPFFPIVHRPTYTTNTSPLMDCVMVAIGSQYDPHPNARQYSLASLDVATNLLAKRDNVTSRSRLTDLQTVFLLEILTRFRSRRVDIRVSSRFRSLYASLTQAHHWLSNNPLAVLRSFPSRPTLAELSRAHRFWLEHETRRRILQAASILDTDQAALFAQSLVLKPRLGIKTRARTMKREMPLPCDTDLWESSPIEEWADIATRSVMERAPRESEKLDPYEPKRLDFFQSRLFLSRVLAPVPEEQNTNEAFVDFQHDHKVNLSPTTDLSYHALLAAQNTPIRHLLAVSGESWLLGKKMEQVEDFRTAKHELRGWAQSSSTSMLAHWHATKLLRIVFDSAVPGQTENNNLAAGDRELNMLHEHWALYLATLICWACGFYEPPSSPATASESRANSIGSEAFPPSPSSSAASFSSAHTSLLDPAEADCEMRIYLQATNVPRAEDLGAVHPGVKARTKGLLEVVRTRKLRGTPGGLLDEAERVLYRLVEGRRRLSLF